MSPSVRVGIGEFVVAAPPTTLVAAGLGSCVAVALFDPTSHRGGLAHVLLPTGNGEVRPDPPYKYAPVLITRMCKALVEKGADRARLEAKVAGGANMFSSLGIELGRVGERNVASTLTTLLNMRIPVRARDVGGTYGRTVELDLSSGSLRVRSLSRSLVVL